MSKLQLKVESALGKIGIKAGDHLLAAVSGGPDSVALLLALVDARERFSFKLSVCHVNHLLRPSSDVEAKFVAELASSHRLACAVISVDAERFRIESKTSPEEAARILRHEALAGTARIIGADRIAIAHTTNDRVETLLHNIFRGSGTKGLHSMAMVSNSLVRPMLDVSRTEVIDFLAVHGQPFLTDESNLDTALTRNKIRLEVIPAIDGLMGSSWQAALLRLAEIADDEDRYLAMETEKLAHELFEFDQETLTMDKARLREADPSLVRRVIRLAIEHLLGHTRNLNFQHISDIVLLLERTTGSVDLPCGVKIWSEYDRLMFSQHKKNEAGFKPAQLEIPGSVMLASGSTIVAESVGAVPRKPDQTTAFLDAGKIESPLIVRSRRPGDRFVPVGMTAEKKIQDFFVDEKVPLRRRDAVPIVESKEGIVWIAGMRVDSRFAASPGSHPAVRLSLTDQRPSTKEAAT